MATVGALTTTIIGDLNRGDLSISDIVLIDIKSAVRDYEAYRFYFNERQLSITLSATNTYALSLWTATDATLGDIIEVDALTVLINGNRRYQVTQRSHSDMVDLEYGPGIPGGNPENWCIYNQSIIIDTYPNPAITGTIRAHVKFADMGTAFTDDSPWTNDAKELIRNATLKRLWGRRFKSYDDAQAAAQGEQAALAALQRRTSALAGSVIGGYL